MKEDLITIITPAYNCELRIAKTINSVINQDYTNYEYIIVNDGSTDKSLETIEVFSCKDSRIKVVNQQNKGVSKARNAGLDIANGKYILFLDSDDTIQPNTLSKALEILKLEKTELVFWSYNKIYDNNITPRHLFEERKKIFLQDDLIKLQGSMIGLCSENLDKIEHADSLVTVWGKLYLRKIIQSNNIEFMELNEIGTSEDALFNFEYLNFCSSAVFIKECLYNYSKNNPDSITTKENIDLIYQWDYLFEKCDYLMEKYNKSIYFQENLYNRIALSVIGLGLQALKSKNKYRKIKILLRREPQSNALSCLSIKDMRVHWKIFFFLSKHKQAFLVMVLLKIIQVLKRQTLLNF